MSDELSERDHRVLGPALGLFSFSDYSPGIAFWHPKGMIVYNELVKFMREEWDRRGFQEVRAPQVLSAELWKKSGHYDMFRQNMFFMSSEEREFALKPMNCPGHCVMFGERVPSYKELPIRLAEVSPLHRNENSGSLNGLKRVRSFSQDDAHIFCRPDQVEQEVLDSIDFLKDVYKIFNFKFSAELSLRPAQSVGSDELWAQAEAALRAALSRAGVSAVDKHGEGAFYGPKIDFQVGPDALGRSWQCGTVQLDFNLPLPERFDLKYRGEDNAFHRPVMIHRAIFGSFERFIGMLIEFFDGVLPFWLAPEQIRVLPVKEANIAYAESLSRRFRAGGCRAKVDVEDRLSKRLRDAMVAKVPVTLVVGDKEQKDSAAMFRRHGSDRQDYMSYDDLDTMFKGWIRNRSLDPTQ